MADARPAAKHGDIAGLTFEAALKELEGIVGRLERGDVELEESINIYERGEALKQHCDRLLRQAEAKVERSRSEPTASPPAPSLSSRNNRNRHLPSGGTRFLSARSPDLPLPDCLELDASSGTLAKNPAVKPV